MLIVIEGLDGVGKSSVVDHISSTLNIPIISKPLNRLLELSKEQSNSIKERIHKDYSPNLQAMYYLMGHLSALEDGHRQDSILDRGFLSTYYFSSNENPSGSIKCSFVFVATQVRIMFPVLPGISGSNSTTFIIIIPPK